jgi:predicted ATPase
MDFFARFNETPENPAMFVVGGHSGVGKSSFIQNVFDQIFARKDLNRPPVLLCGKHDRIKHTPYSAMIDALGGIVKKLMGMSEQELQWWIAALQRALHPNGQVCTCYAVVEGRLILFFIERYLWT